MGQELSVTDKSIQELSDKFNKEFDQALINACIKKGFVLNVASAPDFMTVEHDGWKTFVHVPTNTLICKYSSMPEIIPGIHGMDFGNNEITIRCEIKFIEL